MSPIDALTQGYATLTGQTAYWGELPAGATLPCAVLRPYTGQGSASGPTWVSRVQVTVYHTEQEAGALLAEAARAALHQKSNWEIGFADGVPDAPAQYVAMRIDAEPVVTLEPRDWQGSQLYRSALSLQVRLRPA